MKKLKMLIGVCAVAIGMMISGTVYAEEAVWQPEIYIKAINPGYTVDGKNNVGEMIEIGRNTDSDDMISLAGITVRYTTSSGSKTDLVTFPENSLMAGESIILRLASSPDHELAALNYTKTLAYEGELAVMRDETLIDAVCWTGKAGCYPKFKSGSGMSLVREGAEGFTLREYEPEYHDDSYVQQNLVTEEVEMSPQCKGLMFSELLSYYGESQAEQFVELYNTSSEQVLMNGCAIRYKNKLYPLDGIVRAEEYVAWYLTDFAVTKNPTTSGMLELVDVTGEVVNKLEYPNGQKKGTSWAFIGYDEVGDELWRTTYRVTPGEPNIYQEYKSCEDGKVINEATGNCVKVTEVITKICAEGQYLNILTGRCKKIEESSSAECKEGYERNPDTGRCRKIKENTGAEYVVVPETYEEESSFVALNAVLLVVGAGLIYVGYEFRREIRRLFGKVWRRFR